MNTLFIVCYCLLCFVCICNCQIRIGNRRHTFNSRNVNADFCRFLAEMANFEKTVNKNIYKNYEYKRACDTLAAQARRIKSGDEAFRTGHIEKHICRKIDEFLKTGKVKELEKMRREVTYLNELIKIPAIGLSRAKSLVNEKIRSINDLHKHPEMLTEKELTGLRHYEDFMKPIPREEIIKTERVIKDAILKVDNRYGITFCGSFRRGSPFSKEMIIVLTHPKLLGNLAGKQGRQISSQLLKEVVNALKDKRIVTTVLSHNSNTFMGVIEYFGIAHKLTIITASKDQLPCAILHFTGPDEYIKMLKNTARLKGLFLDKYSLRPYTPGEGRRGTLGKNIPLTSEKDVFDHLNMTYKAPTERGE